MLTSSRGLRPRGGRAHIRGLRNSNTYIIRIEFLKEVRKMDKNKKLNFWMVVGVVNAIVLYTSSLFFPTYVVIGNEFIEKWMAIILTAFLLTVCVAFTKPVMKAAKLKVKGDLAINITYGIANIVGLWIIARLAKFVGFGISSFWVVIALGVLLTLIQYAVWKILAGRKGKK